jgi:ABC-type antimicrobial peptide transport system permease subunit
MRLSDKAALAWSNLGRRKVRTALTSTGVVVGITTLVLMVSLVNGVQQQVRRQFEEIGLDRVVVRPPGEGFGFGPGGGGGPGGAAFDPFGFSERTRLITPTEIKRWSAWPEARQVTPEIEMPDGVASGLKLRGRAVPARISGNSAPRRGPFSEPPKALHGSLEVPGARGSLIVSQGALKSLKIPKHQFASLIGQKAEVILAAPRGQKQSYSFKISGISSEGGRTVAVSTQDRLAMKGWWLNEPDPLKSEGYDSVTLRAADVTDAKALVSRLRKEKWSVQSIDAILEIANRIFAVITAMLALVSGVALLVACIGIANTMIMAIYERTREIGTLKAMGASRSDIRQVFMAEAGLIGLFGGAVGLVVSWLLGRALNAGALWYARARDLPLPEELFIITPALAVAAIGFAFLIGVLAGLYPAARAARLDPLAALRHE